MNFLNRQVTKHHLRDANKPMLKLNMIGKLKRNLTSMKPQRKEKKCWRKNKNKNVDFRNKYKGKRINWTLWNRQLKRDKEYRNNLKKEKSKDKNQNPPILSIPCIIVTNLLEAQMNPCNSLTGEKKSRKLLAIIPKIRSIKNVIVGK